MLLAIDPGNIESAFCWVDDDLQPNEFGKVKNKDLLEIIYSSEPELVVIERIASYGMAVGKEIFETCEWVGRFTEAANWAGTAAYVYRKDVKMALCGSTRAKDSNIRQALIDRYGEVGTKKNPGWFYGFKGDIWSAYAVAVTVKTA